MNAIGPRRHDQLQHHGMAKWLETSSPGGDRRKGKRLFSPERGNEMWSMHTPSRSARCGALYADAFQGLWLGWDHRATRIGYRRVSPHGRQSSGPSPGSRMIPELGLGILVFTNQENGAAMEAVGGQILDAYLGAPKRDRVGDGPGA